MKLAEIIGMCLPIQNISKLLLPPAKARVISDMRRCILKESEFYSNEDYKLKKLYAITDKDGNIVVNDGRIRFENHEIMQRYLSAVKELENLEIEFVFEPLVLLDAEISRITGEDVDNLRNLITFGGD